MSHDNPFIVEWSKTALRTLIGFNKIDHDSVFRLSQNILSKEPFTQAGKLADYCHIPCAYVECVAQLVLK